RLPYFAKMSNSSPDVEVRARADTAASAASTSQLSIAVVNASRAFAGEGTFDSSAGFIRQPLSLRFVACADLKLSSAQKIGSQRSLSGPASAAWCAELTTRTEWNLKPTLGRG